MQLTEILQVHSIKPVVYTFTSKCECIPFIFPSLYPFTAAYQSQCHGGELG